MSLDIDALKSFVVLAEELHFGRASLRLHISQLALTKQSALSPVAFAPRSHDICL